MMTNSLSVSLISTTLVFSGVLAGLLMGKVLPSHHLTKESQDTIKLGAAMIATLTALVLGLLVSSAKNTFDTMNLGIVQGSAKIIVLDRVLARYGPETAEARAQLRRSVLGGLDAVWPDEKREISSMSAFERGKGVEPLQNELLALVPQTDSQRQLLGQARQLADDISMTRWLLIEEGQNILPTPFLVVLLSWLSLLFFSFGLFAPRNGTVIAILLICALSVSGAIFLVLELNRPMDGLIKISSSPLRKTLEFLGR